MENAECTHELPPRNLRRRFLATWRSLSYAAKLCRFDPLQDNTLVARPPRQALPVEVFQQGSGIFSGCASELLERGHADALTFVFFVAGQKRGELIEGVSVVVQVSWAVWFRFFPWQDLQN